MVKEVTEDGLTRLDLTATCAGREGSVAGAGDRPDDRADGSGHARGGTGWESRRRYPYTGPPWGK